MDPTIRERSIALLFGLLKPLEGFMDDPKTQEIMVNGPGDVWVEQSGKVSKVEVALSENEIRSIINCIAKLNSKELDPIVDARLQGYRIAAVLAPIATRGHTIAIRKHSSKEYTLDDYERSGAFSVEGSALRKAPVEMPRPDNAAIKKGGPGVKAFLQWIVKQRKNVIVAGGTSSGKTTFLRSLIAEIDMAERVITIEDTQELQVKCPNWVSLEANEIKNITTRMLLKASLRMRPDRIIVGEVRGPEAFDLMQAANTGHDGCFATLHANSAEAALSRLETLVLTADNGWAHSAIKSYIAETFDYVLYLSRSASGVRGLDQILELKGMDGDTYQFENLFNRRDKNVEPHEARAA